MAKQGYWREALFRFEKAAKEKPDDAEIQNDLAVAYEANGETVKALAAYRRAIELAPTDTSIRRNYARFAEYYTSAQRVAPPACRPRDAARAPQPADPPRRDPGRPDARRPAARPRDRPPRHRRRPPSRPRSPAP